jgi:Tol biopolymer transport system component
MRVRIGLPATAVLVGLVAWAVLAGAALAEATSVIVWTRIAGTFDRQGLVSARPDGSGLRRLTNPKKGATDIDAQISPDGTQIIFGREVDDGDVGSFNVRIMNANGGNARSIDLGCDDPCAGDTAPTWFPNGDRIAFTPVVGPFDGPGGSARSAVIYSAKTDGSGMRRLSEPGIDGVFEDYFARFSPDGSYIIFTRVRNQPFDSAVYRMDRDGSHVQRLTPWRIDADLAVLSQATRGRTKDLVAFETYGHGAPRGKSQNLRTVPATCRSLDSCEKRMRRLTHIHTDRVAAFNPSWSPDGRRLAYTKFGLGKTNKDCCIGDIMTMRPDGSHRQVVSASKRFEYRPGWGVAP